MSFQFNFTQDQLSNILINNDKIDSWYAALTKVLPLYGIDTIAYVAAFLAQTCHESSDYRVLEENLHYSADELIRTWPDHFNDDNANDYAENPEKIANLVYANRMGNGDESSGDGYAFRGRGIIQITGRDNYSELSSSIYNNDSLLSNPDWLLTPEIAVYSACWFWKKIGANGWVDVDNFQEITRRINGGLLGEEDRENKYQKYLQILQN